MLNTLYGIIKKDKEFIIIKKEPKKPPMKVENSYICASIADAFTQLQNLLKEEYRKWW